MTTQSHKEDGRPAQQWYWDDWFSSHDVQSCSFAAQGLWVNMLGIMFVSEIRGTLTINGIRMDNKAIAKRFRMPLREINKLIADLEQEQVFSRLEDGTIYSRRMYRDSVRREEISRIRSKAGKQGMYKRWKQDDNRSITKSNNKRITKITASSSSPTPTSTSSSKNNSDQKELDSLFEKWFKRYPRTDDKGKAKSKWLNLIVNEGVDPQLLEDALTGYINHLHASGTDDLKFVKHAKTFLYNGDKKKNIEPTWKPFVKYADPKYKRRPEL